MPQVLPLLAQSDVVDQSILGDEKKKGTRHAQTGILKLFIREAETPSLSVVDFAHILKALDSLHAVILKLNSLGHAELVVGALDSGSDKSLDVIGIAEAISKLSDVLFQAWDRIRFARPAKASAAIKAASDGIGLLTQVASAVQAGSISAPEGEKLRRTVLKSLEDLFSNGVYTESMEKTVAQRPSELPVERRKLLTHRPQEDQSDDQENSDVPEEREGGTEEDDPDIEAS